MSAAHSIAPDPLAAALARAPTVRSLTPEQRAELDQDMEDIRAGRAILVPHEHVHRALEEMRRQDGG